MRAYDKIMEGLNEALQYEKGEISARREKVKVVIQPVPDLSAERIKSVRAKIGLSQRGLAAFMGVSEKTVEGWEGNKFPPRGPARRLFEVLDRKPEIARTFVKRTVPIMKKGERSKIKTAE